jgi:DNA primase
MEEFMFTADLLRRVRNELPMWAVIAALARDGPPSKVRDGRFVFLCPWCGEMLVVVNPRNNLAHCFGCGRNFNNIDLLLSCDYDFRSAVVQLEAWLDQYLSKRSGNRTTEAK